MVNRKLHNLASAAFVLHIQIIIQIMLLVQERCALSFLSKWTYTFHLANYKIPKHTHLNVI